MFIYVKISTKTSGASSSKLLPPTEPEAKLKDVDVGAVIDTLEQNTMGETWLNALQPEFKKPYFLQVSREDHDPSPWLLLNYFDL